MDAGNVSQRNLGPVLQAEKDGELSYDLMRSLSGMIHEILPVGMLACNCSVLGDEETREAIVIDPGD